MTFRKKIASTLIAFTLIAGGGVALAPQPAYALFGIGDIVLDPTNLIQNTITAVASAKTLLNPIFYRIAQAAIQAGVKSTVNWINSGFQGSPAYATDIQRTLLDASDAAADQFISQLSNSSGIKSPFRDQIAQSVLAGYRLSTSRDGFSLQNAFSLGSVSDNPDAFLGGDFSRGGFSAWFSTVLNPQNNPIGARAAFENELTSRISAAQGQLHEELGWGSGFLSSRDCKAAAPTPSNNGCPAGMTDTLDGQGCQPSGSASVNLNQHSTCLGALIQTPGAVIASTLNKKLGLGDDSLVNAKEFDEIVNALLGQLLNNVLGNTGLGGLSRGSAATGGKAYFDQPSSTSSASTGAGLIGSFTSVLDQQTTALQTYQTEWQKISDAATAAKGALSASTCLQQAQVDAYMDAQVTPTITQAATQIGKASTALTALDAIRTQALNAAALTVDQQANVLSQTSATYQDLLSSNKLPTPDEFTNAQAQSTDTGSATPASLLTQMNQLASQAKCST